MKSANRRFSLDWYVVIPTLFLLAIGFTIQSSIAYKQIGIPLEINLVTQLMAVALAVFVGVLLHRLSINFLRQRLVYLTVLMLILLTAVLLVGDEIGGATRWLQLGSFQLQPTEIAKIVLILSLAHLFDTHRYRANSWQIIAVTMTITAVMAVLVAAQPDLGSAIVFVAIWLSMLLASRIKLSRFGFIIVAILASVVLLLPFLAEYQQERLVSYFNPARDTTGASYNVHQASIAIGSGGITGLGLSGGSQSQLNFLPSQHTDFIFAVTAEKLGLIGAGLVLIAFAALIIRLLYRGWQTDIQYHRLLFVGFATLLSFHLVVNVGMNMGLVPVTGLPLPFLSYGGTFLFSVITLIVFIAALPSQ